MASYNIRYSNVLDRLRHCFSIDVCHWPETLVTRRGPPSSLTRLLDPVLVFVRFLHFQSQCLNRSDFWCFVGPGTSHHTNQVFGVGLVTWYGWMRSAAIKSFRNSSKIRFRDKLEIERQNRRKWRSYFCLMNMAYVSACASLIDHVS